MQIPLGLDPISFFAGVAFMLVLSLIAFVLNIWWRAATSPFRPQIVPQTTRKTPWQVVVGGLGAIFQYVGFALLVASAVLLVVFGFTLEDVRTLGLVGLATVIIGTLLRAISG
jgi:hypothetical protein